MIDGKLYTEINDLWKLHGENKCYNVLWKKINE